MRLFLRPLALLVVPRSFREDTSLPTVLVLNSTTAGIDLKKMTLGTRFKDTRTF